MKTGAAGGCGGRARSAAFMPLQRSIAAPAWNPADGLTLTRSQRRAPHAHASASGSPFAVRHSPHCPAAKPAPAR